MKKKKEEKVTVNFVSESNKKICSVDFDKETWDQIVEVAVNRFVIDAIEFYLDRASKAKAFNKLPKLQP